MNTLFIGTRVEALKAFNIHCISHFQERTDIMSFHDTRLKSYLEITKYPVSHFILIDKGKTNALHELDNILTKKHYEILLSVGFPYIIPQEIFRNHSRTLFLNLHPHILPKWKGFNSIKESFAKGEKSFGASLHYMIPEMDSGKIIYQLEYNMENQPLDFIYESVFSIIEPIVLLRGLGKKIF